MSQQRKDMSGVLFKNDRKQDDKHPDYKGSATVNGREFWMDAWINEGQKGKYMSFRFKPKEARPQTGRRAPDDFDDSPPF